MELAESNLTLKCVSYKKGWFVSPILFYHKKAHDVMTTCHVEQVEIHL